MTRKRGEARWQLVKKLREGSGGGVATPIPGAEWT